MPLEEKVLAGLFLCSEVSAEILQQLKPEWNEMVHLPLEEKFSILNFKFSTVFPWKDELSEGIDHKKYAASFFIQPDLFLRIRPGHSENVLKKLRQDDVPHKFIPPFTLQLSNSFKADTYFDIDREVVVQDLNSQRVGEFFFFVRRGPSGKGPSDSVWDCCAASGGKSIMAYDLDPSIDLTVSDVRESILINLKKRFQTAGIKKYKSIVANLSNSRLTIGDSHFDLVIADVPCSGSGTWSRTPEQLSFFDERKIEEYASLQKKITGNLISHLKPGGHLLYITCSVFKKENEEVVQYLKNKFHLQSKKMELLKGYAIKADTMFAELLFLPGQEAL